MPIVEPHLYADTPLFRGMLYERKGRYPGTPEDEEPYEAVLTPPEPDEPTLPPGAVETPSGDLLTRVVPLAKLAAVVPVIPQQPDGNTP